MEPHGYGKLHAKVDGFIEVNSVLSIIIAHITFYIRNNRTDGINCDIQTGEVKRYDVIADSSTYKNRRHDISVPG